MTLDLDELERVARAAAPLSLKQSGDVFSNPEMTYLVAVSNPSVALELIRLARLGKWAEDVGVTSLKTITLQRMSRHVDIGLLANFTLRVAQEALDYLPKYTAEFVDDGKEGT